MCCIGVFAGFDRVIYAARSAAGIWKAWWPNGTSDSQFYHLAVRVVSGFGLSGGKDLPSGSLGVKFEWDRPKDGQSGEGLELSRGRGRVYTDS